MVIDLGVVFLIVLAVAALLGVAVVVGSVRARRARWRGSGHCACGYATIGLLPGSPCPECGRVLAEHERQIAGTDHQRPIPRWSMAIWTILPVFIGAALVVTVCTVVRPSLEAFAVLSPTLLPFIIHAVPLLVMGRWAPKPLRLGAAIVPATATAVVMGGAFALDWSSPPQRDDMMYPYTLYFLAAVLALPWSLLASGGLVWWIVVSRRTSARANAVVKDPPSATL